MIKKLRKQIKDLENQIEEIQEECIHPKRCVTKTPRGSSGNYDPSNDRYWYECECSLCEKRWTEPQ
jgi:hypothetical protein